MAANEQLDTIVATTEMDFKVGDFSLKGRFIVMAHLLSPIFIWSFIFTLHERDYRDGTRSS